MIRRLLAAARNLLFRRAVNSELDIELQALVDLIKEEKLAAGLSEADALRAARLELGGVQQVRHGVREARAGASIERCIHDVRGAIRWLRRSPGFATSTIAVMAVGLGSVTAAFAVMNAVLFSAPAGISNSERLVAVDRVNTKRPWAPSTLSYLEYVEYRDQSDGLELAASTLQASIVRLGSQTERVRAEFVTPQYFQVLGVSMARGRRFLDAPNTAETIVSPRLLRTFGVLGDPLGKQIHIGQHAFEIVGVVPEEFRGPELLEFGGDLWLPADFRERTDGRVSEPVVDPLEDRSWRVFGRLEPGLPLAAAYGTLRSVASDLERRYPDSLRGNTVTLRPGLQLAERHRRGVGTPLALVSASAWLLFVVCCANAAFLSAARNVDRTKEIALRLALGAGRGRVARQLVTETLLLAFAASALGLALAPVILTAVGASMPAEARALLLDNVSVLDGPVLVVVLATSGLATLLAGLLPARRAVDVEPAFAIRHGGVAIASAQRTRLVLATAQVAVAVLLLSAAGLLASSLYRLRSQPLGFDGAGLELARLHVPEMDVTARGDLLLRMHTELAEQPGLTSATIAGQPPLQGGAPYTGALTLVGTTDPPMQSVEVLQTHVGPAFFETIDLPVLQGRSVLSSDTRSSEAIVVVNQSLAEAKWPGRNPVGMLIQLQHETVSRRIVGVVATAHHIGLSGRYSQGVYLPLPQVSFPGPEWVIVRARGDTRAAVAAIQDALRRVHPDVLVYGARSMEAQVQAVLFPQRAMLSVAGAVGFLTLVLTVLGLAATVSHAVARRRREIAIRLALGARTSHVRSAMIRPGLITIAGGSLLGVVAYTCALSALSHSFTELAAGGPLVPAAACMLVLSVALVAMIIPVGRGVRVPPSEALRAE